MRKLLTLLNRNPTVRLKPSGPSLEINQKSHNHSLRRRNYDKRNSQFLPQICAATGENWVAKRGATEMRQEQQAIAAALSAVDFKFRFQMTNAGTRHDCSVTIQAVNFHDAAAVFRAHWPTIENLARRSLTANDLSDIRLEAAPAYQGAEIAKLKGAHQPPESHGPPVSIASLSA
jgi:hypothetical protein